MRQLIVNIDVGDLEKATRFYTQALNLRIGRRIGEDAIELLGLASPLYLLSNPEGSEPFEKASHGRSYSRHWTPVHLDFVVESIEIAVRHAQDAGAVLEEGIYTAKWGKIAQFADPFGNGFCIIQFLGRGYDEIATDN